MQAGSLNNSFLGNNKRKRLFFIGFIGISLALHVFLLMSYFTSSQAFVVKTISSFNDEPLETLVCSPVDLCQRIVTWGKDLSTVHRAFNIRSDGAIFLDRDLESSLACEHDKTWDICCL